MSVSKDMVRTAAAVLTEKKGEDLSVIDISEISVLADYFVIVSADNLRQVAAISDAVEDAMAAKGFAIRRKEGGAGSGWLLLDYNDIIIHIFDKEQRFFYDLERIWSDGKKILNLDTL